MVLEHYPLLDIQIKQEPRPQWVESTKETRFCSPNIDLGFVRDPRVSGSANVYKISPPPGVDWCLSPR